MKQSGRAQNAVLAILGIGLPSMLAGCADLAPSSDPMSQRQLSARSPAGFAVLQGPALTQEDEAAITRAIENRFPSSVDSYYMVKSIAVEGMGSADRRLSFVANVDWAGFGPVTGRYFTVRGLFDPNSRRVVSLGPLTPREPPREP